MQDKPQIEPKTLEVVAQLTLAMSWEVQIAVSQLVVAVEKTANDETAHSRVDQLSPRTHTIPVHSADPE